MHQKRNLTVQKDRQAIVHVVLATAAVLTETLVTVTVAQMQARQTAVSVTAQRSAKNLTHVTANLEMVSVAKAVQIVAQHQRAVTTTATKAAAMHHAVLPMQMQAAVRHVVHVALLE
jgi:hypothetical protein